MNWLDSNFTGSLVGAVISGVIAIWVMKRQMRADELKQEKLQRDNFYKSSTLISIYADKASKAVKSIPEQMIVSHQGRGVPQWKENHEEAISFIKVVYEDMISYKKMLDQIKDESIYADIFETYLNIKLLIDDSLYYTDRFLHHNASTVSPLEVVVEKLEKELGAFQIFVETKLESQKSK
ncbi:hypothetical protein V7158_17235 [Priestia megaterium]|uniref:hypothetical protein n=3 Tax=Priestia megaterium TaxID=1404 RepID=UPI0030004D36